MEIIALDAHKRYSQVCVQNQKGQILCERRINHVKGQIGAFLWNGRQVHPWQLKRSVTGTG
jgi:hypothetical protein